MFKKITLQYNYNSVLLFTYSAICCCICAKVQFLFCSVFLLAFYIQSDIHELKYFIMLKMNSYSMHISIFNKHTHTHTLHTYCQQRKCFWFTDNQLCKCEQFTFLQDVKDSFSCQNQFKMSHFSLKDEMKCFQCVAAALIHASLPE